MSADDQNAQPSGSSKKHKLPRITELTEEQMNQLISVIPKRPLTSCQAQLHRLAGNVTVEIEEEPFEAIVAEEEISSDEEEEPGHSSHSVTCPHIDEGLARKKSVKFSGRQIQPVRRPDAESFSSQTGKTSFQSDGTSRSSDTELTEATSTESRRSERSRRPIHQRRRPEEIESLLQEEGKKHIRQIPFAYDQYFANVSRGPRVQRVRW